MQKSISQDVMVYKTPSHPWSWSLTALLYPGPGPVLCLQMAIVTWSCFHAWLCEERLACHTQHQWLCEERLACHTQPCFVDSHAGAPIATGSLYWEPTQDLDSQFHCFYPSRYPDKGSWQQLTEAAPKVLRQKWKLSSISFFFLFPNSYSQRPIPSPLASNHFIFKKDSSWDVRHVFLSWVRDWARLRLTHWLTRCWAKTMKFWLTKEELSSKEINVRM